MKAPPVKQATGGDTYSDALEAVTLMIGAQEP